MCDNVALYTDNKFNTDLSNDTIKTLIEYSIYVCSSNSTIEFNSLLYSAKTALVDFYLNSLSSDVISILQSNLITKEIQKVGIIWPLCVMIVCFIVLTILDIGIIKRYSVQIQNSILEINDCGTLNELKAASESEIGIKPYSSVKERVLVAVFVAYL